MTGPEALMLLGILMAGFFALTAYVWHQGRRGER